MTAVPKKKPPRAPVEAPRDRETLDLLLELHRWFNARIFGGKLPTPVIRFGYEPALHGGAFNPEVWGQGANAQDEIVLHPLRALNGPFEKAAALLVHQIAHQAQYHFPTEYGEPPADTNKYFHPREWIDLIEDRFGLEVEADDAIERASHRQRAGECVPTRLFRAMLHDFPLLPPKAEWQSMAHMQQETAQGSKNRHLLYRCACTRVRCATVLDATCGKCKKKFRRSE